MRYLASTAARKEGNPWTGLLAYLKEAEAPTPAPRKLAEWQMYMLKKGDIIAFKHKFAAQNVVVEKDALVSSA